MAEKAIIAKLNDLLADPIDSECKAVYLLCEVRKLLEHVPVPNRPFALNMYCHWALHVNLHGRDTISPFLKHVDDYLHRKLGGHEDLGEDHRMVQDFLSLETLRSQLRDLCQSIGIRTDLTDSDDRWNEFVRHYAGVIEDGSLAIRAQTHDMRHVKQLTFTKGRNATGEFDQTPFDMLWHVDLLDGRSLDIDVNARPARDGVGSMVSSGIHLNG